MSDDSESSGCRLAITQDMPPAINFVLHVGPYFFSPLLNLLEN